MRFTLFVLTVILLLQTYVSASTRAVILPRAVHPVRGFKEFETELEHKTLIFAKFFHPRCPHCRAMKADYDNLANNFHAKGIPIRFIEIDCSTAINRALMEKHASGFPTLKVFLRGRLVEEFNGPRDEKTMGDFLLKQLEVASRPLITRLSSISQRNRFLESYRDRPVVLRVSSQVAGTSSLGKEFNATAEIMRDVTLPKAAFAIVSDPSLLIPDEKRFDNQNVYSSQPYAAAASRGDKFLTDCVWWFAGVRGADDLRVFMHVGTRPRGKPTLLTASNAPYLASTGAPILFAFGSSSRVPYAAREELRFAAETGGEDLVVLYGYRREHLALREHAGLPPLSEEDFSGPAHTQYVLYRMGNLGVERETFVRKKHQTLDFWVRQYFQKHRRAPARMGSPGQVNEMTADSWDDFINHDGRSVLIHFFKSNCDDCVDIGNAMKIAARSLQANASKVVVTSFDLSRQPLPKSAKLELPHALPQVVLLPPGEKPQFANKDPSADDIVHFTLQGLKPIYYVRPVSGLTAQTERHVVTQAPSKFIKILAHMGVACIILGLFLIVHNSKSAHSSRTVESDGTKLA